MQNMFKLYNNIISNDFTKMFQIITDAIKLTQAYTRAMLIDQMTKVFSKLALSADVHKLELNTE